MGNYLKLFNKEAKAPLLFFSIDTQLASFKHKKDVAGFFYPLARP